MEPWFNPDVLSLADRGVVFAMAHIRGGEEMGRYWYEDQGKLMAKRNTFTDFIACAEALIGSGWTRRGALAIQGGSAGGLLVGSCMTMRPDLYTAVVGQVPFVDLMVTMCDPSIPLTTAEWTEWGNPNCKEAHEYMLSYSPMDNLTGGVTYPSTLFTAGLHDPRVAYWEPAKFIAKLRHLAVPAEGRAAHPPVLLKTDLDSGHFSASDRYKYKKEKAFVYAYILDQIAPETIPRQAPRLPDAAYRA
jgi:oligopeptidase B